MPPVSVLLTYTHTHTHVPSLCDFLHVFQPPHLPTLTPSFPAPKAQGGSSRALASRAHRVPPQPIHSLFEVASGYREVSLARETRIEVGTAAARQTLCRGIACTHKNRHTHTPTHGHTRDRAEQLQPRCWRCAVQQDSLGASMVQHDSALVCFGSPILHSGVKCYPQCTRWPNDFYMYTSYFFFFCLFYVCVPAYILEKIYITYHFIWCRNIYYLVAK